MHLIAYAGLQATPWKNGGGVTRELACHPPGATFEDFIWRVSIADVGSSGPFSAFAGVDRIITLLDGDGMLLQFADGTSHALNTALVPYRFRGEDRLHAQLLGAASRDFNLMLRRGLAHGEVTVACDAGTACNAEGDALLLFCATGRWQASSDERQFVLQQGDSLLMDVPAGAAFRPLDANSALLKVSIIALQD